MGGWQTFLFIGKCQRKNLPQCQKSTLSIKYFIPLLTFLICFKQLLNSELGLRENRTFNLLMEANYTVHVLVYAYLFKIYFTMRIVTDKRMYKYSSNGITMKVSITLVHGFVWKRVCAAKCFALHTASLSIVNLEAFETLLTYIVLNVFTRYLTCGILIFFRFYFS